MQHEPASEYWESILESICDGFWVLDRQWRCTYINNRQAQLIGRQKEDVLGKNVWELFPDLVGTEFYRQLHGALVEQTPVHFEHFFPTWQGWFEIRVYPSANGVSILMVEITAGKQTEEAVRESEQHLKIALQTAKLGSWQHDLVTGILSCSEQCKANFGLPPDADFSHETLFAALHPEDLDRIQTAIQRAIEEHTDYEVEERCFWPDGSLHWLIARGRLIYDSDGTPIRMVGVTLDITERKQFEESLKAANQRISNILASITDAFVTFDRQWRYSYVNQEAARLLQHSPEELLGKNVWQEVFPEQACMNQWAYRELHRAVEEQSTVKFESFSFALHRWVEVSGFPFPDGLAVYFRDISERKRQEQRKAARYAVTRVLAEATTLVDAVPAILQSLCESLGWQLGVIWSVDRHKNILHYVNSWQASSVNVQQFIKASQQATFALGVGLPGRIWQSRQPIWIAELSEDTNFSRAASAAREGLQAAFGFPIQLGDEILGVIECFSDRLQEPDEDLLEMMAAIGSQIGQFMERKRTEEALRESQELFQSFMNNSPVRAYIKDEAGRYIYINRCIEQLFHYTVADWFGKTDFELFPAAIAAQWRENDLTVLATDQLLQKLEIEPVDGERYLMSFKFPFQDASGRRLLAGMSLDVTEQIRAQEALETNLAQLEAVLHSMTDGLVIADPQGNILRINSAALALHEFQSIEDLPEHLPDIANIFEAWELDGQPIPFPDWPISRAIAGETFSGRRIHVRRIDTGKRWVAQYGGTSVRNKAGEVILTLITITDITAQFTAEEALRQSEERYRAIYEQLIIGVSQADNTGRFISVNERFCEIAGRSHSELLTLRMQDITHPDDLPQNLVLFQQMLTQGTGFEIEKRYIRPDNSHVWVRNYVSLIKDAADRPLCTVALTEDITDRKQAEAALLRSQQELTDFVENAPVGMHWVGADGTILWANQCELDLLGYSREEYIGHHIAEFHADQEVIDEILQRLNCKETLCGYEARLRHKDGSIRYVSINSNVFWEDGKFVHTRCFAQDITDRKQTQAALRSSEERLALASVAAKIGTFEWNIQTNQVFWTEEEEALYGLPPGGFEGKYQNWRQAVHPDDIDKTEQELLQTIANGTDLKTEFRILWPDGSVHWIAARGRVFYDSNGNPIRMIGVNEDISDRKRAEEVLREREQRFSTLFNGMDDWVLVYHLTPDHRPGQFIEVNEQACKKLGYSREELLTMSVADVIGSPSINPKANVEKLLVEKHIVVESIHTTKDGRLIFVEVSATLFTLNGLPTVQSICRDITQRKQAEEALRKSERLYRAIGETIDYGIWVCEPNGRNIYVSESFLRLLGLTQEQCSEFGWGDVLHPDDAKRTIAAWKECARTGGIWDIEHRFRGVDGNWHPILARGVPVRDENGEIICWAGINLDISRSKRVEAQLRESEERFRALIEHAPDAILIANTEGTYIDVNTSACRFLGYERDELICKQLVDIIPPEELPRLVEFKASLLTGNTHVGEWTILRKDGTPVSVEVSTKTLPDGRRQAFIRDITERKRAEKEREQLLERERAAREEAEAANRIKDEFLAVLSHELRTPLNPILGWTRLLRTRKFDEQATDRALETIERNAKLQTQLIEDLLDVSRILQGKIALNVCPVNLVSTIEAAIETVRLAAQAKKIQIQTQLNWDVEPISGDPSRLQQIVWNLVSNAVKFTPAGGRVEVRLEQLDSYAQIQVKDTGKGISQEFLPHVFEYFRQADSTITRTFGGLGLGLAIVRHLTELHGGTVQAQSLGEGQGATFTVLIPRMVKFVNTPSNNQPSTTTIDLRGLRVLVVDDEADMRDLVVVILSEYRANVRVAASAAEALLILDQFKPDVLVSDIGMPEVDGYTLMRQIRTRPPHQSGQIPAIALTAYAGEVNQQQALAAGFQRHVPKPVEPEELARAIADLAKQTED